MNRAIYVSSKPSRRLVRRLPSDLEVAVVRSREIAETLATRESFDIFLVDIAASFADSFVGFVSKNVYQPYIVLVMGRGYHPLAADLKLADSIISQRPSQEAVRELGENIVYPELYLLDREGGNRGRAYLRQ